MNKNKCKFRVLNGRIPKAFALLITSAFLVAVLTSCSGFSIITLKNKLHGDVEAEEVLATDVSDKPVLTDEPEPEILPDFEYRLVTMGEDRGFILRKYNGEEMNVTVPSEYEGIKIREIYPSAFGDNMSISTVNVSYGIEKIGDYAFYNCANLERIYIPATVASIGADAFASCVNLSAMYMPESITYIGESLFNDCVSLSQVGISSSLEVLPHRAFENCSGLTYVYIPHSVKRIESGAFKSCKNLNRVDITEKVLYIADDAFEGCDPAFCCPPDSYAESYAKSKGFDVVTVLPTEKDLNVETDEIPVIELPHKPEPNPEDETDALPPDAEGNLPPDEKEVTEENANTQENTENENNVENGHSETELEMQ